MEQITKARDYKVGNSAKPTTRPLNVVPGLG